MFPDRKYVYVIEYKEDENFDKSYCTKEETFTNKDVYANRLINLKTRANIVDIKLYCGEIFRV
jgi:hypothetical protein